MPTYIRCTDDSTGHQVDIDERSSRRGLTPIAGYPPNSGEGASPRPPKYRVTKDGRPVRRRTPARPSASTPVLEPHERELQ